MQYLNGTYTLWLNARHRSDGPVFRGRYRSQCIASEEHLRYVLAYIHLKPVKALLVRRLDEEAWASHRAYVGKETPPEWLTTHGRKEAREKGGHPPERWHRLRSAEDVLAEVLKTTGAKVSELRRREAGRGANPARRFAIWALNRSSELSQAEIARFLDVPYHQVTRLLSRLRRGAALGVLSEWIEDWLLREQKVSSADV